MSSTSWDNIHQTLFHFLHHHMDPQRGVLLGLSGGSDSMCLYRALLEYRKRFGIFFAIAHVDHGWRQESHYEAEVLQNMANQDHVPFYCKQLAPISHTISSKNDQDSEYPNLAKVCEKSELAINKGSSEEAARNERLRFFLHICNDLDLQAVLLAHHADDQGETVLKRLFEGASLTSLRGMRSVVNMGSLGPSKEGLVIWRPFLSLSKKQMMDAVHKQGFVYFHDVSNEDPKFLRSRLRQSLLPHLSDLFGKEISVPLSSIANEALEIEDYLDAKILPLMSLYENKGLGGFLDISEGLSEDFETSRILLKHLIRRICYLEDISLSRTILEQICQSFIQDTANQRFKIKDKNIYVDRRRIFFPKEEFKLPQEEIPLHSGMMKFGPWSIFLEKGDIEAKDSLKKMEIHSGFAEVWKGHYQAILPEGDYTVRKPQPKDILESGKKLAALWSDYRVPAFLRNQVPVIATQGVVFQEFLTGKTKLFDKSTYILTITCETMKL